MKPQGGTADRQYLFDWGGTLMEDLPGCAGPMCDWPEVRLVPGAAQCLTALGGAARCHLATNARDSAAPQIRAALARGGIDHLLGRVFCFREVGHMKPAAAYFEHVVAALGCPPRHITMVGDSLRQDVRGALACGLRAVWLNRRGEPVPPGVRAVTSLAALARTAGAGAPG